MTGALNVDNDIVGVPLSHHRPGASNGCGVARKHPLRDVASDSDALNVDNDIVVVPPSHHGPGVSK